MNLSHLILCVIRDRLKIGNIAPRAGFEPIPLAFPGLCANNYTNLGSLDVMTISTCICLCGYLSEV